MKNIVSFIMMGLLIVFSGCGDNGSIGSDTSKLEVTVVDGYIKDATVTDSVGNSASLVDGTKGLYRFSTIPTYPISSTGGVLVDTSASFDVDMSTQSGVVISPISTIIGSDASIKNNLLTTLGLSSESDLIGDYVNNNSTDVAKLAQLCYAMLKDTSSAQDSFKTRLRTSTDSDVTALIEDVVANDTSDTNIKTFLNSVKNYSGNVSDIETSLKEVKTAIGTSNNGNNNSGNGGNTTTKSGILDTSFASVGYLTTVGAAGGTSDTAYDLAIDSSENIYVTGYSYGTTTGADLALWKYNSSGVLDTSFGGGDGIVIDNNASGGSSGDQANSIALDSSGNIYITGKSKNSSNKDTLALWKYDSNGSLDTSFGGGDGIATYLNSANIQSTDEGQSITLDSSGNIYISGDGYDGTSFDMALFKFTSLGVLDTSFGGGDGIIIHHNAGGKGTYSMDYGKDIAIDNNGSIYIGGSTQGASSAADVSVWKYTSSGVLDTSFGGGDGITTSHNAAGGNNDDKANAMAVDSNGSIYLSGYSVNSSYGYTMAIWKFDSNGVLDTSFGGGDGIVTYSGGYNQDEAKDIVLDSSGNIFVSGYSKNSSGNIDLIMLKFDSSGNLDTSYATNGVFIHNPSSTAGDIGFAIKLNSSDEPYIVGRANADMSIWKLK